MSELKHFDSEVKMNIKGLRLAKLNKNNGEIAYLAPEIIDGIMEISREVQTSSGEVYGDGRIRRQINKRTATKISLKHNGLPQEWRAYMEGVKVSTSGVESDSESVVPGEFAMGYVIEKTNGKKEFVWLLDCVAQPSKNTMTQSEDKVTWSTDTIEILSLYVPAFDRSYTSVDMENKVNESIKEEDFFSKVQTDDAIQPATPRT